MTNRLELNWKLDGFVDEQRYYCSETPINPENLPEPTAVLSGDVFTYTDSSQREIGKKYHVMISAVKNSVEKISDEKVVLFGEAWTPSNLTTAAKIWLDSDTAVAGEVSSIANIGSIGGTFNQPAPSLRPYIVESVINGHNVMRLDGVDDIISLVSADAGNLFRNTGKGWFFSVVKSISGYALFDCRTPANSARFLVRANPGVQQLNIRRLDSNTTTFVSASAPSDFYIRFDLMDWQTATGKLRQNGLEVASKSLGTAGLTSDTASNSNAISFGNTYLNPVSGEYFGGDIAFAIAGSGVFPTSQEIQKLEGWAAHKYGLTANLPSDHPYKILVPVL